MKHIRLIIGFLLPMQIFIVSCAEQPSDPDPLSSESRPNYLIIGDTCDCQFEELNILYGMNESIDFDGNLDFDFLYYQENVYIECNDPPNSDCNPDSGCVEDCWPTIYIDYILKNFGTHFICVDEFNYPLMLSVGDSLSPLNKWLNVEDNLLYKAAYSNSMEGGNWNINQDGYLGLCEIAIDDTIYSWVKMNVKSEGIFLIEYSKMK
jgi:hypothetical protein